MRLSSVFALALAILLAVVALVDFYSLKTHPRLVAVLHAAFGEAPASSLHDGGGTAVGAGGSEATDPTGGFKPLRAWTTGELAAFVERGGHRELRAVRALHKNSFPPV